MNNSHPYSAKHSRLNIISAASALTWFSLAEDSMKAAFQDSANAFPSSQLMTLKTIKTRGSRPVSWPRCWLFIKTKSWIHKQSGSKHPFTKATRAHEQTETFLVLVATKAICGVHVHENIRRVRTYRSMCRSFLFPTSIIGTLYEREIMVCHFCIRLIHVCLGQKNKYLLNFSHHIQQLFMDNLYHFKTARNQDKVLLQHAQTVTLSFKKRDCRLTFY